MQPEKNHKQLLEQIERDINLPSPPAIAVKILDSVQQDDAALTELGTIISADPALTAKMLKVANSGIFTRNGKITNIKRAMTALGTNVIKNIALSFIIAEGLRQNDHCGFDFERFWRRSVTSAVAAELLTKELKFKSDDIFVTALLQDLGMLIIALTKGDGYAELLREAETAENSLINLETETYGFNHQQVSYALLLSWNFPESITEPILFHHQPESSVENNRRVAEILYYSHQLADIYNTKETAEKARILQQDLSERFNLGQDKTLKILDITATSSRELLSSFELDPKYIRPYSVMLQEANIELGKLHLSNEQLVLEMKDAREKAERLAVELKGANSRLKELVYRDGLTELYNHRYFQETLGNELARARRYQSSVSLILFDIDHFKQVNDTHGHPAGDLVLINIARAVSSAVRPSDIVARYGGEEFAVILPETSAAGVKVFAARLRRCIEGIATLVDGQLIYVTVSAGATTFSPETAHLTKDILIETADRGLYTSKQNGRNQVTILEPETLSD